MLSILLVTFSKNIVQETNQHATNYYWLSLSSLTAFAAIYTIAHFSKKEKRKFIRTYLKQNFKKYKSSYGHHSFWEYLLVAVLCLGVFYLILKGIAHI